MSTPLGGDWGSGERVFGPPRGTVEPDWFVPLVRERHPGATHEAARTAVAAVWQVVHAEAAHARPPSRSPGVGATAAGDGGHARPRRGRSPPRTTTPRCWTAP